MFPWPGTNPPSISITRFDDQEEKPNDGFDIEGDTEGVRGSRLMPFKCEGLSTFTYSYRPLVNRYAKLGLHRYNMMEGTKFELDALIKFNLRSVGACSFLITLAARDTVAGGPMQIFQVRVDENRYGLLDATCTIARIKGGTTKGFCLPQSVCGFPDWPSDGVFERFCSVEISKLRSNPWIRLYLELTVYTNNRMLSDYDLSKLEIMKVAIETTNDEPPLKAKSSVLYIAFKGLARNGFSEELGEELERRAIIKSVFDEQTGSLSLMGDLYDATFMTVEEMHYHFRQDLSSV